MANEQWRRALRLCSWLRYGLEQQEHSDFEVEQMHRRAKEALAKQVSKERAQQAHQKEWQRLQNTVMYQSASGTWMPTLDSIALFYQNGASQQQVLDLLQEFKKHLSGQLPSTSSRQDPKTAALVRRFNEILAQVRGDA